MTQYIADLLRKLQKQMNEIQTIIDQLVPPEDGDFVYVDKSRGGECDHDHVIPPYEVNDGNSNNDNNG